MSQQKLTLKEQTVEQLKALAWDLRTFAETYTQALQNVVQELGNRIQTEKPIAPSEVPQINGDKIPTAE